MRLTADFHVHSRYSAATSPDLNLESMADAAMRKGINLLGTGDFTHPEYFREIQTLLEPAEAGLLKFRSRRAAIRFILTVEVSHIYYEAGRQRRIHQILFAPSLDIASKINERLARRADLAADGRPVLAFPPKDLVKLALDLSPDCLIVPAHIWTPWFSLFGSAFGFDSLEACYQEEAGNIHALETGLDSDPSMNARLSALERLTLISSSDAHSLQNIGREVSVFDCGRDYFQIMCAIKTADPSQFLHTLEFFSEEGKYYWDGHRACGVSFSPAETREQDYLCPECGKKLTLGVLHRVEKLADRPPGAVRAKAIPFKQIIPLHEILAAAQGRSEKTKTVEAEYERMLRGLGTEFEILLERGLEEIKTFSNARTAELIEMMRAGKIEFSPGYDGEFGTLRRPAGMEKRAAVNSMQGELF